MATPVELCLYNGPSRATTKKAIQRNTMKNMIEKLKWNSKKKNPQEVRENKEIKTEGINRKQKIKQRTQALIYQ